MGVVFAVALAYGATADRGPQSDQERSADLAASIACPQCSGQPVSESNAPIAEIIRTEIKQQVDEGLTDNEIVAVYVNRYGAWVDLNPSRSGLTGVVWIAPFLVIGLAVGALALAFSRWRGPLDMVKATSADRSLVETERTRRGKP
jgi:cytochrome c-type biogenesis protein CcmH/NrfF